MHRLEVIDKSQISNKPHQKRPDWLKIKTPGGSGFSTIKTMMRSKELHTVCEEARCPNISECWNCGTATFMILGDECTRSCRFCAIKTGNPLPPDPNEPYRVAESVKQMNLSHTVITSVNRDDLPDGGSIIWAKTIEEVKKLNPSVTIEVLIPDFKGDFEAVDRVIAVKPEILNHNVETVPSLYKLVRPQAKYQRSLDVLEYAKSRGMKTKTGFMVGFGETRDEVIDMIKDLRIIKVDVLTIGQYLQPSHEHLPVVRYVHPEEFIEYRKAALEMGFEHVESAPLVRSSYHAERHV